MNNSSLLSPSCLVSLTTSPFLLSIMAISGFAQSLVAIGQTSEEIFRGDRLPVLPFPESDICNQDNNPSQ
jgi:hypothetical protein